jgi:UDP-galactopyranose mutase
MNILIVGCGLSGVTLAERFANDGHNVKIIDRRNHIGGNVYDYINSDGIRVSKYGAHILHSSSKRFWDYIEQFAEFNTYIHKVKSHVGNKLVPVPVNIDTVNSIFDLNIQTKEEMEKWLKSVQYDGEINNSKDAALARVGKKLYKMMFENYTIKQWNMKPEQLERSVLERIPVRLDHNDRYFSDTKEGLPTNGYTSMIENMLKSDNIEVKLKTDYFNSELMYEKFDLVFFTGKIDTYFNDKYGKLKYRSLRFEDETHPVESFQDSSVVNYPEKEFPYTRIIEHKKLYKQTSAITTITKEYSADYVEGINEPYYPYPTPECRDIYQKYQNEAEKLENDGIYFVGRLASYKYVNMDQAVEMALDLYNKIKETI